MLRDSPSSGYSTANVQNVPSFDAKYLEEEFEKEFPVGRWFVSGNEAFNAVQKWQMSHFNRVRREGRQGAKCSCSSNSHLKKKESGEKQVAIEEFSLASGCNMQGRVCIAFVNGRHNHPCNLPHAASVQKLSGRDVQSILPKLVRIF